MAKENLVLLHGVAVGDTTVKYANDKQTPARVMLYLRVVDRAVDDDGRNEIQYATIFVYSGDPKIIQEAIEIEAGDLVDVFGTLTTTSVKKQRTCPSCGAVNIATGDVSYVSPTYICRREHGLSEEETEQLLIKRCEFSNRIVLIGHINNTPKYNDHHGLRNPTLIYQMAVDRTVRVKDGTSNDRKDYPWVVTSGIQAVEGKDALEKGSVVYVKGHLRSKEQVKEVQCEKCNNVFTAADFPLIQITPHFTEYIYNCNFPEATKVPPTQGESN